MSTDFSYHIICFAHKSDHKYKMSSIIYTVKDKQFVNKFQAANYAAHTGCQIKFDLYESAFDKVDWSSEPKSSWDDLLDLRAQQIANKNKPIVLHFSGGTDSYTIYKVFERNNIHIDMVWVRGWEFGSEKTNQAPVLDFIHKEFYDKSTKIVIQNGNELMAKKAYFDENWIWDHGMRYHYGQIGTDKNTNDETAADLGTEDFIAVIGFEKPRLLFDKSGVYSYQDDENYIRPMADPRFDCFYISPDLPELHVKQSYMMLSYIKSLRPNATTCDDLFAFNEFHNASKFSWNDYSINACGRFGDLNNSQWQHIGNRDSRLVIPSNGLFQGDEYRGRMQHDFLSFQHEQYRLSPPIRE